jgi:hypothetical protein
MKSKFKIVKTGGMATWHDRANDAVIFSCDTNDIPAEMVERVLSYGMVQIVQDGAASASGIDAKRASMQKRWNAILTGTWGTRAGKIGEHSALFAALVALGKLPETARAAFDALPPVAIAKLYTRADVVEFLGLDEIDTDELLEEFAE